MDAYDNFPPDIRAAIAYADDNYSIEELYKAPEIRQMTREELLNFLWENADGFEIRYPYHVRVQYRKARAAPYRNNPFSDWDPRRYSLEVLYGRDPFGPLR